MMVGIEEKIMQGVVQIKELEHHKNEIESEIEAIKNDMKNSMKKNHKSLLYINNHTIMYSSDSNQISIK